MIILVIGVCGSGKSSTGKALAQKLSWPFVDADGFHSEGNITKMKQGVALTDEDRLPWLAALQKVVRRWQSRSECGVLACSALKQSYRDIILQGLTNDDVRSDYIIFLLEGPREIIKERLLTRNGHFMAPELLDSQLNTLEVPENTRGFFRISIEDEVEVIANHMLLILRRFGIRVTIQSTV